MKIFFKPLYPKPNNLSPNTKYVFSDNKFDFYITSFSATDCWILSVDKYNYYPNYLYNSPQEPYNKNKTHIITMKLLRDPLL